MRLIFLIFLCLVFLGWFWFEPEPDLNKSALEPEVQNLSTPEIQRKKQMSPETQRQFPNLINDPINEPLKKTKTFSAEDPLNSQGPLQLEDLTVLLESYKLFSNEELLEFSNNPLFVSHLLKIASGQEGDGFASQYKVETAIPRINALNKTRSNRTYFPSDYLRIFMHFNHPEFTGQGVIVRWLHLGSKPENRLIQLSRHTISPRGKNNYVWAEQENGWLPGNYLVEVFSADAQLALLAQGSFQIQAK